MDETRGGTPIRRPLLRSNLILHFFVFQVTYYLEKGVSDRYPMINLDSKDGSIFVRGDLDRELEPEFTFTVIARDGASQGSEDLESEETGFNESRSNVTVLVLDANDNSPNFYGYTRLRRKEGSELNDLHAVLPIYTAEVSLYDCGIQTYGRFHKTLV